MGLSPSPTLPSVGNAEIDAEFAKVPSISDHAKQVKASNDAEKKSMATYGYLPVLLRP